MHIKVVNARSRRRIMLIKATGIYIMAGMTCRAVANAMITAGGLVVLVLAAIPQRNLFTKTLSGVAGLQDMR